MTAGAPWTRDLPSPYYKTPVVPPNIGNEATACRGAGRRSDRSDDGTPAHLVRNPVVDQFYFTDATLKIRGRLLGADGRPAANALVEIWHADPYRRPRQNLPSWRCSFGRRRLRGISTSWPRRRRDPSPRKTTTAVSAEDHHGRTRRPRRYLVCAASCLATLALLDMASKRVFDVAEHALRRGAIKTRPAAQRRDVLVAALAWIGDAAAAAYKRLRAACAGRAYARRRRSLPFGEATPGLADSCGTRVTSPLRGLRA